MTHYRKGIILAGGKGTRLYPITKGVCKQLLPVYDKPMIYYPLSVLMLAGIRDILIISQDCFIPYFQKLFRDGVSLGLNISYAVQNEPRGIADAFLVGQKHIGKDHVCLVLGDNIFFGHGLPDILCKVAQRKTGATVLGYYVKEPQHYGIAEINDHKKIVSLCEKPKNPRSHWAITGLYFYDNQVVDIARYIKRSRRGELEITAVNQVYLRKKQLNIELLGRGYAWLDTGTAESLIDASIFIKTLEERQGLKVGCIEEIAYRKGFINSKQLLCVAQTMSPAYREYLCKIEQE